MKNQKKKFILCISMILCLASLMSIAVFAEYTGYVYDANGNEKAAFNYDLSYSWWPWSDVKAYSNTSFIVDYSVIQSGFTAYSSVFLSGTESNPSTVTKTVYVSSGTNYANTGNVTLEDHRSDSFSEHRSVYEAEGVSKYLKIYFD